MMTYKVGDVLYTDRDDKVTLLELAWRVKFENGKTGFRRFSQLRSEPPLKKITRKELADMGYELEASRITVDYINQQQKKEELLGLYKEKTQLLLDDVYVARPYIELDIRIEQLEKELEELK